MCLKPSKHTVLRAGFDADQVHKVDDDQKDPKHAANHHKAPGHLMRALVFFAHCAELAMRKQAEGNAASGQAQAYDPVE